MAIYEYRCPQCGRFEVFLPMGTAPASHRCSACGRPARRVQSAPNLSRTPPALAAALTAEERSREAPEVVTRTSREERTRPPHPALARLPRP
ncbi:FmdB family zinc ribbon protein [Thermostaphylospora chromogena]|uniref:FmdB family zinc ribbon protein n=1 Tax=Thermostaphylospora chromogena TaxID=35622 RepID=UPI000B817C88